MQKQGKDIIIKCHVGTNGQQLNQTTAGYQFGADRDRSIVTSLDQLIGPDPEKPLFPVGVQREVDAWLKANGVQSAQNFLNDQAVEEAAPEFPGTLDAIADKLGLRGAIHRMLTSAMHGKLQPPSPPADVESATEFVDGVPVVQDAKGIKHRLPDPILATNPKVTRVDGGVLLDKGNGHKEFRADYDVDAVDEQAILDARDQELVGAGAGKAKVKGKR